MLNLVTPKHHPPRILIYSQPKMGKSTFGSLAPNPVFIQTEDGLDALGVSAFPLATSFGDVLSAIEQLATEEHDFKTVVVDSLDWLEKLIHVQVCAEKKVTSLEDIGYGKGYMFALDLWRQYLDGMNYLRTEKGMVVVQIAHSHIKRFENPETDSYDRHQIKMHDKAAALVMEQSDIIIFVGEQIHVKKTQDGFSERKRAVGTGERVLYTEGRPSFVAGNRYSLPPEIPFNRDGSYWSTIAEHVPFFFQGE